MIIGIKGRPRQGKTAIGVKILLNYILADYFAVTNVPVNIKQFLEYLGIDPSKYQETTHPLSIHDINRALDEEITLNELYGHNPVVIYISEMMQYAFSRKSGSNTNAMIAYMLSQLGKTNTTFIWDAQLGHTVDVILRELTEWEIHSYKLLYTAEFEGKIYNNCILGFKYDLFDMALANSNPEYKPSTIIWPIQQAMPILNAYRSNITYKSDVLQLKLTEQNKPESKQEKKEERKPAAYSF